MENNLHPYKICIKSQIETNLHPYKIVMPFIQEANGNAYLFNTHTLQLKVD